MDFLLPEKHIFSDYVASIDHSWPVIAGIVCGVLIIVIYVLRLPIMRLKKREMEKILEQGFCHITTKEEAKRIVLRRIIPAEDVASALTRRDAIFFYTGKISKFTRKLYEKAAGKDLATLQIGKITEEQLEGLRTRRPLRKNGMQIFGFYGEEFRLTGSNEIIILEEK